MNNILPGGIIGDIYRIYHSAENKNELFKMGKSFQSVVFERLSGQIMLFGTFLVSLVASPLTITGWSVTNKLSAFICLNFSLESLLCLEMFKQSNVSL